MRTKFGMAARVENTDVEASTSKTSELEAWVDHNDPWHQN